MMSSFRKYTISGTRFGVGVFVKGKVDSETETQIEFTASVQPLNGKDLMTLPEGQRETATYWVYTDFELKTVDEENKTRADRITLFDKIFEIIKVEVWRNQVMPHYRAVASLVDA